MLWASSFGYLHGIFSLPPLLGLFSSHHLSRRVLGILLRLLAYACFWYLLPAAHRFWADTNRLHDNVIWFHSRCSRHTGEETTRPFSKTMPAQGRATDNHASSSRYINEAQAIWKDRMQGPQERPYIRPAREQQSTKPITISSRMSQQWREGPGGQASHSQKAAQQRARGEGCAKPVSTQRVNEKYKERLVCKGKDDSRQPRHKACTRCGKTSV